MESRSFIAKLKRRMTRGYPKREVRCDSDNLWILEEDELRVQIRWIDIVEVFAYKIDLVTVDEICIGFRLDDTGIHYWVSEEFLGYEGLLEELKSRFPGIRQDWFSDVAFPAFVANRTTLWGKPYEQYDA